MIDIDSLLIWHKFNNYEFHESDHTYWVNGKKVKMSVTQYVHSMFNEFDSETISKNYALKHNIDQQLVLDEWSKKSLVASTSGTIIHNVLENFKRGKVVDVDYSNVTSLGIEEEVRQCINNLLPKAEAFHKDTVNKLYPIQLEYVVGIDDIIAGSADMICWNEYAKELQIWDYKNCKEIKKSNGFGKKGLGVFHCLEDCNFSKYSVQLNMYKVIIQRILGVSVGKCYLVHFNPTTNDDNFMVYECYDLQNPCNIAIDQMKNS